MSRARLLLTLIVTAALIPLTAIIYRRLDLSLTSTSVLRPFSPSPKSSLEEMPPQSAPSQAAAVIVVGSGLAGLTASYSALRAGARSVVLLERAPKPGGNSIKASSGINGCPTRHQPQPNPDSVAAFRADTVRSAGRRLEGAATANPAAQRAARERLVDALTEGSRAAVEFLTDEVGVDLSRVAQLGGHSFARTHRGSGKTPPGAAIVTALLAKLKEDAKFELRTGCEVSRLLRDDGSTGTGTARVTGVEYRTTTTTPPPSTDAPAAQPQDGASPPPQVLRGPVVFATGGFAGDAAGLLATYRPDLAGMPSTNDARPGMHHLLEAELGAALTDMDAVQVHPTGFVDPASPYAPVKFLAAEMLRGEGGILLNGQGSRFVNEMDTRERVSNAIMAMAEDAQRPEGVQHWDVRILLDPGACDAAGAHIGFYTWKGLMKKIKVRDLDGPARAALRDYADVAAGKREDKFGRTSFGHWRLKGTDAEDDEEVCIGSVTPVTHFTMGGAAINDKAQILTSALGEDEKPIQGLWAAGEITGGLHGDNRLGGSSLLECVVFGLIAGEQAATSLDATT
ncbi:uncharacterized protein E0L32_004542 [Thyridium curvatum]|uniref:Fumarate reductase n=1 Tax=Thyridium curvatum TaxID=1093900 RepID=A0A507AWV9_9PEZI|nr:uncharacterized protein E0L32_004542 [Thyridium curvatum]TPX15265.1 hypothetical protein E0L32_004542 [Thyridium curvatum]